VTSRRRFLAALPGSVLLGGCAGLWRASAPPAADALQVRLPAFTRAPLGGATLLCSAMPQLSTAEIGVSITVGAADDPPGRPGFGRTAIAALLVGSLREELARLGAEPQIHWDDDGAAVSAVVEAEDVPLALATVAERLRSQQFTDADLAMALLETAPPGDDPAVLAALALRQAIFPADHPYARGGVQTLAGVRHIERADVERHLRARLRPDRLAFVVAGAADPDAVTAALKPVLEGMDSRTSDMPAVVAPAPRQRTAVVLVPRPGVDQCVLAAGCVGLPAGHADALYLDLAALLLQWSLYERLREERGLTYGVAADHGEARHHGVFGVVTHVDAPATGKALQLLLDRMETLRRAPVDDAWVHKRVAAEFVRQAYVRQSADSRLHTALRLHRLGLAVDHDERRYAAMQRFHASALLHALREFMGPERMAIVAVGDEKVVRPQLERAGHEVVVRTAAQVLEV
jgi:zinc protease